MRTPAIIAVTAFVSLSLSLSLPAPLFAAEPARDEADPEAAKKGRARELTLSGFEALQRGETERAIARFSEAERLYHAVTIVLLLAQANERLGRVVEARALYRSIMNEALPPRSPKEFIDAKVVAKRGFDALAGRFATVIVRSPGASPDAVTLTIDGAVASPFDAAHPLNPGTHTLTLIGRGGASVTQSVSVKAGDEERVLVPFASLDPYGPGSLTVPAAIAFGVGLAGLGAGAVTAGLAQSSAGDSSARCVRSGCSPSASAKDSNTLGVASAVSFAAGGASLATSAILLYVGRRGRATPAPASSPASSTLAEPPAVFMNASSGGITIRGSF